MSSIFEEITLTWGGKSYYIPSDRVMPALARVEEVLTLHELEQYQRRGTVPLVKLSQAYGSVLRYAGCSATDEEVYREVIGGKLETGSVVTAILLMMLPKNLLPEGGTTPSGNVSKAEGSLSKKRTKSPSAS